MSKKYVSRVIVMRNGTRIVDFKNYKKSEVKIRESVDLMDEPGTIDVPKKYQFSIDYVIPKVDAKLDWSDVIDENWSFQYREGGPKTTYTGVDLLTEGDAQADGQKEVVMTLSFQAQDRIIE